MNLDRVVTDIMDISDNVLRAIETNSGQETVLEECCGCVGGGGGGRGGEDEGEHGRSLKRAE